MQFIWWFIDLVQDTQNIIISACHQYWKLWMRYFAFCVCVELCPWNPAWFYTYCTPHAGWATFQALKSHTWLVTTISSPRYTGLCVFYADTSLLLPFCCSVLKERKHLDSKSYVNWKIFTAVPVTYRTCQVIALSITLFLPSSAEHQLVESKQWVEGKLRDFINANVNPLPPKIKLFQWEISPYIIQQWKFL